MLVSIQEGRTSSLGLTKDGDQSSEEGERPPQPMTADKDESALPRQVVLHKNMGCEPLMVIRKVTREKTPFKIYPVTRDTDLSGAMEV